MKFVKHIKKQEWGIGEIVETNGYKITIDFINAGVKLLNSKIAVLEEILDEGEITKYKEDRLLCTLNNKRTKKISIKENFPIEDLIQIFLSVYPKGFYDPNYIENERKYKENLINEFKINLSKEKLLQSIENKNYSELSEISKKLISASKNIHSIEKTNFRKAISKTENQEKFINSMYNLFYTDIKTEEERFIDFKDCLETINCSKWTIITYFMNMLNPDRYLFLKPKISKKSAEILAFDINYNMTPNWNTYFKFLKFAEISKKNIDILNPRDYIDVECFMWIIVKNLKKSKENS
ncbi:DUF3553 domain-containing protein [uncultured Ilyobacter sp.]|uniref:DUF3553 domain-containing protein n=1 Tax=uncultured Ilyobacter sp. TaxID=544433 RepID=UPI0029C763AA|nr:DUF3553 domain-containing protein [uncultured Ilyobacter sp.]